MGLLTAGVGAAAGVLADQWREYFYCEAMPADVLAKINSALAAALKEPDVTKAFIDGGSEVVASSPAEHAAVVREQYDRWGGVIRKLGLKLD